MSESLGNKVYAAMYNHMTYESSYATISLHRTKQGARDALAKYVAKERSDYIKYIIRGREHFTKEIEANPKNEDYKGLTPEILYKYTFKDYRDWYINELEILE